MISRTQELSIFHSAVYLQYSSLWSQDGCGRYGQSEGRGGGNFFPCISFIREGNFSQKTLCKFSLRSCWPELGNLPTSHPDRIPRGAGKVEYRHFPISIVGLSPPSVKKGQVGVGNDFVGNICNISKYFCECKPREKIFCYQFSPPY